MTAVTAAPPNRSRCGWRWENVQQMARALRTFRDDSKDAACSLHGSDRRLFNTAVSSIRKAEQTLLRPWDAPRPRRRRSTGRRSPD
jgi:hypothetical protein